MSEQLTMDELALAIQWARDNPHVYRQFAEWAREDRSHGARPSIKLYFELARRPHFARKLGLQRSSDSLLLNNSIASDVARLLNRDYDLGFPTRDSLVRKEWRG